MANTCSLHFMISSSGLYMKWSILLAQVVSGGGSWSSLEVGHLTDHFKNHLNPLRPISCSKTFFSQSESWKPANKKPGRVGSAPLTPRLTQSGQRRPPPPSSHLCNTGLGRFHRSSNSSLSHDLDITSEVNLAKAQETGSANSKGHHATFLRSWFQALGCFPATYLKNPGSRLKFAFQPPF